MTRILWGDTAADVVVKMITTDQNELAPDTRPVTIWDAYTGGSQVTDLQNLSGTAITQVTPTSKGRVLFYPPDGWTADLWYQDADGDRWRVVKPASVVVTGVSSVAVNGGTAQTGAATVAINSGTISDATTTGKAVLTASSAAAALSAVGGVDASAIPTASTLADATATGKALMQATDAPTALSVVGGIATSDFPISFSGLAFGDVPTYDDQAQVWVNQQPQQVPLPSYLLQGEVLNPGQTVPGDWPDGAIAFVRQSAPVLGVTILQQGGFTSSNTTLTLTPTNAVAAGENVFLALVGNPPSSGVTSAITATDSGSNTYTNRGARAQGAVVQAQAFSTRATTALTTSSTITATLSAAVSNLQGVAVKLTGLASPAIDQQGANSGVSISTLTVATGGATAQPSEIAMLVVGFNGTSNTITTPAGWTLAGTVQTMSDFAPKYCAVFSKILTTTQTVSVTVSVGVAGTIVGLLNTFKAA